MKTTVTKFDAAITAAVKALAEALQEKNADEVCLYVYGASDWRDEARPPVVELYWEEREQQGKLTKDGTVKLGRKP